MCRLLGRDPEQKSVPVECRRGRRRCCWRRDRAGRRVQQRRGGGAPVARTAALRHRAHRRGDDGEPLLRPLPRLGAGRRRQAGRADLHRPAGVRHARTTFTGHCNSCGFNDPDHSYEGGRIELNDGRCDGWLRAGENDALSIGYYKQADSPSSGKAAVDWTTCDRYFSAIMAETYPNRFYQHAAQTDRLHNSTTISTMPTIWDRLAAKGVSGDATTSPTCRSSRCGARSTCRSRQPYPTVRRRLPRAARCRKCRFVDPRVRRTRRRRRRATTTRTRTSAPAEASSTRSTQPSPAGPELGRTRCWSSTTTSGAASSTTSRRTGSRDVTPDHVDGRAASGCRRWSISPRSRRRFDGATALRPHLDPQGDRVAVRPAPADDRRDSHARNIAEVLDFAATRLEPDGAGDQPHRPSYAAVRRRPAHPRRARVVGPEETCAPPGLGAAVMRRLLAWRQACSPLPEPSPAAAGLSRGRDAARRSRPSSCRPTCRRSGTSSSSTSRTRGTRDLGAGVEGAVPREQRCARKGSCSTRTTAPRTTPAQLRRADLRPGAEPADAGRLPGVLELRRQRHRGAQQAVGNGCVFPKSACPTCLATARQGPALDWLHGRHEHACRHPAINAKDDTQKAGRSATSTRRGTTRSCTSLAITDGRRTASSTWSSSAWSTRPASVATTRELQLHHAEPLRRRPRRALRRRPARRADIGEHVMRYWVPKILTSPA